MGKANAKKAISIMSIIILLLNLLFLALGFYTPLIFWIILAAIAIVSMSAIKLLK